MLISYFKLKKEQPPEVSYKTAVLPLNLLYKVIVWNFVSGSDLKPSRLSNVAKIPIAFKSSFKQNLAHMSPMYLATTLSCEPRFRMFIINSYNTKSKRF